MTTPEPEQHTEQEPPPPVPAREKLLRRSRDDRVIAGVAGGLGRYLGVDPVLLRIAFVILALIGGSGILLYLVGWLVMPEERAGEHAGEEPGGDSAGAFRLIVGGGLIALGALLLAEEVVPDWLDSRYIWPIVLILIGLAVLTRGARR